VRGSARSNLPKPANLYVVVLTRCARLPLVLLRLSAATALGYSLHMQRPDQLHERFSTPRALNQCVGVRTVGAYSGEELRAIRELFKEYADSIEIDLCFQGFGTELAELPGKYAPPTGRLLLTLRGEQAAGCVAGRKIADGICEMKRLYVRPAFRGSGLGRILAQEAISAGRQLGYGQMRLDTLTSMTEAILLYKSLGFQHIEPYYDNPTGCAIFMGLKL